jgi:hypothetical protein
MENYLIKMEFYFAIIINDYKSFFIAKKNKKPIYLKITLNYLIKNNFFVCEWCYVKQKKENNKNNYIYIWALVLDFFQK